MINPQWLELPMSRTIFYGPKDVRAIEVRLYVGNTKLYERKGEKNGSYLVCGRQSIRAVWSGSSLSGVVGFYVE